MATEVLGKTVDEVLDTEERKIECSEIFHSLQGEGPSVGTPAVFVRTHKCMLACIWCDSKFATDPRDSGYAKYELLTPSEITRRIKKLSSGGLVVLTGGEPLIWQRGLADVVKNLSPLDYSIEVETSGYIEPRVLAETRVRFIVSPKLMNTRNFPVELNHDAMSAFTELALKERAIFKFVVMGERPVTDIEEVQGVVDRFGIPRESVYIMPEGVSAVRVLEGMRLVAELCIRRGWHLTPRLHTLLWGNMRGR